MKTDLHAHWLPGIDDGADDMVDTLDILRGLQLLGYDHLIATPHVYQEYYPNSSDTIRAKLAEVQEAAAKADIHIHLEASAEYMLDEGFQELIRADDLLPFGKKHILLELGFFKEPPGIEETFQRLLDKGYQPILAHLERYRFLTDQVERFYRLREMGVLLQMNILSLTGNYGEEIRAFAWQLLDEKLPHLLGTDCHHLGHIRKLDETLKDARFQQILADYPWQNANILSKTLPKTS